MARRLDWASDSAGWPLREHSRFVDAGGLRWHVQQVLPAATHHPREQQMLPVASAGRPRLLLLHGTGASTHSWAGLIGALDDDFDWLAVGHSAGAAILVRMALDGRLPAQAIAAVNGAFVPFGGVAAPLLSPLARLMYAAKWVPAMIARRAADPAVVRRLVAGTGSVLDDDALALYGRLMRCPGHNEAALGMMAHWDLRSLQRDLPRLGTPLHLLVADGDRAVPPRQARPLASGRPHATLKTLHGLGHLAHEEVPGAVADWLRSVEITR